MNYTKAEKFLIGLDAVPFTEYRRKAALYRLYAEEGEGFYEDPTAARIAGESVSVKDLARGAGEKTLAALEESGVFCITRESAAYPADLENAPCPPLVLYAKGNAELLKCRRFSVVGSRRSIPLALAKAEEFAAALAGAGFAVVTGSADGADAAAIKGALKSGKIVSVLAGGIDCVYPACNAALIRQTAERGLVLGEYPPGTRPERFHFPVRNRIIAALGEGLLVVSAGRRSGTSYTAGYAEGLSKQIFALPYNVNVPSGEGCNEYIRRGAMLTTRPEDILEYYGIAKEKTDAPAMTEEEERIYGIIRAAGEIHIDDLAARTGKKAYELTPALGMLEIKKRIVRQAGNVYCAVQ